jgi:LPXTG-motif cell wall-anchored protein
VVGDTVDITGSRPFTLAYKTGSAQIKTNAMNGVSLSDQIFNGSGALIGYNALNGNVPGCAQYSGWVTFKVAVNMPGAVPVAPTKPKTPKTPIVVASKVKTLPDTGSGSTLAIFGGVSALAGVGHYLYRTRRFSR